MSDIGLPYVGRSLLRREDRRLLTGQGQFIADLVLPRMLHAVLVRSPVAHARIRSIDTSKAEVLPGVKAVVTPKDFPDQKFEYQGPERVQQNFWHMTRNVMAREKALYEGHAVAAVAAISRSVAEEAASDDARVVMRELTRRDRGPWALSILDRRRHEATRRHVDVTL